MNLSVALWRWGESQRGECSLLGFRPKTTEYDLTMYGSLCGVQGSDHQYVDESVMDTDRLIATLADALNRVLPVDYVPGGTVKQRVKESGMSTPTYDRNLTRAKQALCDLMLKQNKKSDDSADNGGDVAA